MPIEHQNISTARQYPLASVLIEYRLEHKRTERRTNQKIEYIIHFAIIYIIISLARCNYTCSGLIRASVCVCVLVPSVQVNLIVVDRSTNQAALIVSALTQWVVQSVFLFYFIFGAAWRCAGLLPWYEKHLFDVLVGTRLLKLLSNVFSCCLLVLCFLHLIFTTTICVLLLYLGVVGAVIVVVISLSRFFCVFSITDTIEKTQIKMHRPYLGHWTALSLMHVGETNKAISCM